MRTLFFIGAVAAVEVITQGKPALGEIVLTVPSLVNESIEKLIEKAINLQLDVDIAKFFKDLKPAHVNDELYGAMVKQVAKAKATLEPLPAAPATNTDPKLGEKVIAKAKQVNLWTSTAESLVKHIDDVRGKKNGFTATKNFEKSIKTIASDLQKIQQNIMRVYGDIGDKDVNKKFVDAVKKLDKTANPGSWVWVWVLLSLVCVTAVGTGAFFFIRRN